MLHMAVLHAVLAQSGTQAIGFVNVGFALLTVLLRGMAERSRSPPPGVRRRRADVTLLNPVFGF